MKECIIYKHVKLLNPTLIIIKNDNYTKSVLAVNMPTITDNNDGTYTIRYIQTAKRFFKSKTYVCDKYTILDSEIE